MIKAILFDNDGMVNLSEYFSLMYAKDYGIDPDKITPFFKTDFAPCLTGEADLKEQLVSWLPKWGWHRSVDEFLAYWFEKEKNVDPKMVELIAKLRRAGVVCCLATNQEKYRTNFLRHDCGYKKIFNRIFSSAKMGMKKPSSEFFQKIIQTLELNPNEIQFWDDKQENINAARTLGLDGRIYLGFEEFKKVVSPLLKPSQ